MVNLMHEMTDLEKQSSRIISRNFTSFTYGSGFILGFRQQLHILFYRHPIAGLALGDYRMDGRLELIACATDGEMRGFLPSNAEVSSKVFDMAAEQEQIREMTQRKQNMLLELKNYEENSKLAASGGPGLLLQASKSNATGGSVNQDGMGIIPAQTQLSTSLSLNLGMEGKTVSDTGNF